MSAHLYYYPRPGADLVHIDLGRGLTRLVVTPQVRDTVNDALSGGRSISRYTAWSSVEAEIELSTFTASAGLFDELEVLWRHLLRGGYCALAEEDGCLFGGYTVQNPGPGRTTLRIQKNLWRKWPGSVTTDAGDRIVLRSPSPRSLEETLILSDRTAHQLTFTAGTRLDYRRAPWVFARDYRFWPYLRLQAGARGQQLLEPGHRILQTLRLPLEEALGLFEGRRQEWVLTGGNFDYEKLPFPDGPEDALDNLLNGGPGR